jgi:hypothetical protein
MTTRARRITAALVLAIFALSPTASYADTSSSQPGVDGGKQSKEQFKKERDAYAQALRLRDIQFRNINTTFKNSIERIYTDFKNSYEAAVTPEQKSAARAGYINARAAAITARDQAILALGPLPTPPAEPMRSANLDPRVGSNKSKS